MGFINLVLEGDALGIINMIKLVSTDLSLMGNLVDEAKLKTRFISGFVEHVKRKVNKAAYVLARAALYIAEDVIWIDECLDSIKPATTTDCNSIH